MLENLTGSLHLVISHMSAENSFRVFHESVHALVAQEGPQTLQLVRTARSIFEKWSADRQNAEQTAFLGDLFNAIVNLLRTESYQSSQRALSSILDALGLVTYSFKQGTWTTSPRSPANSTTTPAICLRSSPTTR